LIDPSRPDFTDTPASERRAEFGYRPARADAAPCLTLITPCFDADPALFEQTAASVFRQSLQQWEWVVVDDGSTRADTLAYLAELRERDPRIRVVVHERNRGLPAARNTAVAEARTPFVLQLDTDDLLEPTAAEKWLWFLVSCPEYSFVKGFTVGFGEQAYLWQRGFHDGKRFLAENLVAPTSLIRRDVFDAVGGYDESLREGLEDWEFWLRCAAAGRWGATVPEYLDWYRRKGAENERWGNWDRGARERELLRAWRGRYPRLWRGRFPRVKVRIPREAEIELERLPAENVLAKEARRLLMILPYAAMGGADKFNLDLVGQLRRRGWEITIVMTLAGEHAWAPRFARHTPDLFTLPNFLKPADYPRFLRYLIGSRQPDAILVAHSHFGYVSLPYLRRAAPGVPVLDYTHLEEEHWLGGGYPRMSVDRQEHLDLQLTASQHLKEWMVERGGDPARIEVAYINVEQPDPEAPRRSRADLGLPEDVPVLLYPVRLCEQKQPNVFAKTMRELRRRGVPFVALVAGDGEYLPWLRRFVRRHRLAEQVRLLGSLPNEEVVALLAVTDCVFIPSKYEGIAAAYYEALAHGVPVVGADVGGQRELVTEDCGVLVPRGREREEVAAYAAELERLLADPERRRTMGEAGRERVLAGFALDGMGERMDALLERARERAREELRPVPSAEDARAAALEAIAVAAATTHGIFGASRSARLRLWLLRLATSIGMPVYRLGLRLGLHWIEDVKQRAVNLLQPKGF
jgi:glycosyltransferase involved in cell wall biosynthesis